MRGQERFIFRGLPSSRPLPFMYLNSCQNLVRNEVRKNWLLTFVGPTIPNPSKVYSTQAKSDNNHLIQRYPSFSQISFMKSCPPSLELFKLVQFSPLPSKYIYLQRRCSAISTYFFVVKIYSQNTDWNRERQALSAFCEVSNSDNIIVKYLIIQSLHNISFYNIKFAKR